MKRNKKVLKLAVMGLLIAMSVMLVALIHFPIFPAAPFLEYDPADIPIFVGTFLMGPVVGFVITVLVSLIQGLTVSAASGPIGMLMHVLATGSFALVAGSIYHHKKNRKNAVLALVIGVVVMALVMALCNLVFTPIFMGTPREVVAGMLVPVILPFNLLKGGINALITYIIYKPISKTAHNLLGSAEESKKEA